MVLTKNFKNSLTNNLLNLDIDENKRIIFSNKNKFISDSNNFVKFSDWMKLREHKN